MGELLDTARAFFDEDNWPYAQLEGRDTLQLSAQADGEEWKCFAQAREVQSQFVFYSLYPENTPEDKRSIMAEFITRANFGIVIGNFEMDWNDGETRFKTSIDVEGDRLTPALVKALVYANVRAMRQYMPGIRLIIAENASAIEAIEEVE